MQKPLEGQVALVAGATRGAGRGIALELGAAGAHVYVTGRSTRTAPSEMRRPETIEETADLIAEAGGSAHLYGVSSGGALVLEAAAAGVAADRLAVYEVPYPDG